MAKKATVKNFSKPENYRKLRESLGLTQTAFWATVGETQSNGSRIEAGKAALHPAAKRLAEAIYLEGNIALSLLPRGK